MRVVRMEICLHLIDGPKAQSRLFALSSKPTEPNQDLISHIIAESIDQLGKDANPARGQ